MQKTLVQFLGQKICWRRDRLPNPVFLGFPCGSVDKESDCKAGDLVRSLGRDQPRDPWRRERLPTPVFWPGEFHGLYGVAEFDTTEWLSLRWLWCWEGLRAGEGAGRGWDGWMASPTQWTWVWVNSGSWWWTGRLGMLRFMGSQRVGHDWETELNWTESALGRIFEWPNYISF